MALLAHAHHLAAWTAFCIAHSDNHDIQQAKKWVAYMIFILVIVLTVKFPERMCPGPVIQTHDLLLLIMINI